MSPFRQRNSRFPLMSLIKPTFACCLLTAAVAVFAIAVGAEQSAKQSMELCTDANGIRTVYSAFSLEQFKEGKKVLRCRNGTPWTWCLNKRCTVDPSDPKKAICVCDVLRTEEWITLGGNCDTATCKTGYWSGATVKDFNEASSFMQKALSLDHSPVEWCQAPKP